ncbi:MAG: hypothetical protein H5T86_03070 [Armatimonadetes bacterium]|nr:hypothetical protein [Armatimonadota bacterium]
MRYWYWNNLQMAVPPAFDAPKGFMGDLRPGARSYSDACTPARPRLNSLAIGAVLTFLCLTPVCMAGGPGQAVVVAEGEAYRISTFDAGAGIDISLRTAEGTWVALRRTNGELGWFGYNRKGAGEVRSSACSPAIERETRGQGKVVSVTCELEPGVSHAAEYVPFPSFCFITSEIRCQVAPADASIIRLAPRFDIDVGRFPCYALRDERGILHTGTLASLGERPKYVGVRGWGGGCAVAGLDPQRPYLAFFNPFGGPLFALVYPKHNFQWRDGRHFLQLFDGGANYLYSGFFSGGHFNEPVLFAIYANASGSIDELEKQIPEVEARAEELVRSGVLRVPALSAGLQVMGRLAELSAPVSEPPLEEGMWVRQWKRIWAAGAAQRAVRWGNSQAALAAVGVAAQQ